MKSSMTQATYEWMIVIARFHSLSRLVGMTIKKQL